MSTVRLELRLSTHSEWLRLFDPRDWTVFVPTSEALASGAALRILLDVGGWAVGLRGTVVGVREAPAGVVVAIAGSERDKINYLNGFVRGGLLNLRGKRRLPVRLEVTYGDLEGPTTTHTKDINEEGIFLFTPRPLPETSQVHMLITVPGQEEPLSLLGKVSHTIQPQDDEPPGMGIVFELDAEQRAALAAVVERLEESLRRGLVPLATGA